MYPQALISHGTLFHRSKIKVEIGVESDAFSDPGVEISATKLSYLQMGYPWEVVREVDVQELVCPETPTEAVLGNFTVTLPNGRGAAEVTSTYQMSQVRRLMVCTKAVIALDACTAGCN